MAHSVVARYWLGAVAERQALPVVHWEPAAELGLESVMMPEYLGPLWQCLSRLVVRGQKQ